MNRLLSARVAVGALLAVLVLGFSAHASAPQLKTQAPGFYRLMLGQYEITVLSDGSGPIAVDKLVEHALPAQISFSLEDAFLKDPVDTSNNSFLINTGSKLVLVDVGAGNLLGPSFGQLVRNLTAAGYRPNQIDEIYLTHMHGDHVGGLVVDGKPTFPNATVSVAQAEADFWLSNANMEAAPQEMKGFFQGAMASIGPYQATGRFKPFTGNTELAPGIRALLAAGHTPGHATYVIENSGQKLLLLGDLVHVAALQFADPAITVRFDADQAAAARQRKTIFADASSHGYWVAGAHLPFPGIGQLRASGSGYVFVPANYQSVP